MKKIFLLSVLLIGSLSFGQTKPKTKDVDKESNVYLDSLSKVHKVKIYSILVETMNGVKTTSIAYDKNGKLAYKVIKVEKVIKKD
jgi:hypothetical protein